MAFDPKNAVDVEENKPTFNPKNAVDVDEKESSGIINNFFSNIQKNLTAKETRPIGVLGPAGVISSAAGIPEENLLPMVGQIAGNRFGMPGSVAGATIGQAARQAVQPLRGNSLDVMALPKEAALTAATESIFRGAGSVFKKNRAVREITEGAGKQLSMALGKLADLSDTTPALSAPSKKFLDVIKPQLDKIKVPIGSQARILKRWVSVMEKNPNLTARELIELEQDLGEVAKFSSSQAGETVLKDFPKKALNKLVKEARNVVSDEVDNLAERAGISGFKELSKKVSKNLAIAYGKDSGVLRTIVTSGALGGLVGTATQNPSLGFGISGVGIGLTNPIIKNALYRGIERTGLGRAATLGLSDIARRDLLAREQ